MFRIPLSLLMLTIVFSTSFQSVKAQAPSDAGTYMNEVLQPFEELKSESWAYLKAATRGKSARKVESKRKKLIEELRDQKYQVNRVKAYQGDASLRDAVVDYLNLTYIVFREDYDQILDMEAIAEQSYDDMEAYILAKQKADDKLDSAFALVNTAQKSFAKTHGITLQDGEGDRTDQKIKLAGEALDYYNELYLIFFRCYKQEAYVMEALGRNDVMSLEQSNSALTSFATEALEKLNGIDKFKGDAGLIIAARDILEFYRDEAERDFPAMVDFYIRKDNFEKLSKMMESKKKKDLTEQDIEKYNQAVEQYNTMIPEFNKLSESSYDKRVEALELWNEKVQQFFDKHTS